MPDFGPGVSQRRVSPDRAGEGTMAGPCSSMASTTESSVAGRPLQSLFAPREFLAPAGAEASVLVEQVSGAVGDGCDGCAWVWVMRFSSRAFTPVRCEKRGWRRSVRRLEGEEREPGLLYLQRSLGERGCWWRLLERLLSVLEPSGGQVAQW